MIFKKKKRNKHKPLKCERVGWSVGRIVYLTLADIIKPMMDSMFQFVYLFVYCYAHLFTAAFGACYKIFLANLRSCVHVCVHKWWEFSHIADAVVIISLPFSTINVPKLNDRQTKRQTKRQMDAWTSGLIIHFT